MTEPLRPSRTALPPVRPRLEVLWMPLEPSARYARIEGLMSTPLDREIVILNMPRNSYVALDEIGRRIWELLESPHSAEELCRVLCTEFEGSEAEIVRDVTGFLEQLQAEELIRSVP
ncbi:MAG: PqqD family protein [Candidatus Wallbacteria bacterium]|nr:PqqD family protein [Candidatus Wallbacteria bacterium]